MQKFGTISDWLSNHLNDLPNTEGVISNKKSLSHLFRELDRILDSLKALSFRSDFYTFAACHTRVIKPDVVLSLDDVHTAIVSS